MTAVSVAVAACSTDSASESSTVKMMVIGDFTAPGFSFPQIVDGAQAAVNETNLSGGINGDSIELLSCDAQNDPNAAAACARKAVQENVSAVVGLHSLQNNSVVRALEGAGIPSVGSNDLGALDRTSPVSFPMLSTPVHLFSVVVGMPHYDKCAKPGVLHTDVPAGVEAARIMKKFYAENVPIAAPARLVPLQVDATDVTARVATVLEGGTDCVFLALPPTLNTAVIKAIDNVGANVEVSGATPALPESAMRDLGEPAVGVYSTTTFKLPGVDPAADTFSRQMAEVNPDAVQDVAAESAYSGVKIVAQAMEGLTDYSGKSVLAALNEMTNIDVGLAPVIPSFADSSLPGLPRTFNTSAYSYQWTGDHYELLKPEPTDVSALLGKTLASQ
ncbi:ABC transporter substrate-binding protein (plasmid) [Rhodococcus sp. USK10]|uniref:ABC transporter substrate-binding protein n=1 Tax=Rhodococcus sp. USK10 TaxID=2789739 RepID=UPI001C5D2927|nr:ABC transporter substrate-binding protein [Rhodococcus sp. USK10]QYB00196.1 ABC transporter substrate-binding protein [Rhodococcus sp. USK10]